MNTLTSDIFVHFGIAVDKLWNVCRDLDSLIVEYYTNIGLDCAGIRALRLLIKIRPVEYVSVRIPRQILIKCDNEKHTNVLRTQLIEKEYSIISLIILAYFNVLDTHTTQIDLQSDSLANIIHYIKIAEKRDVIAKCDEHKTMNQKYEQLIVFRNNVYNTFKSMCGSIDRIKTATFEHGYMCFWCTTMNDGSGCVTCGTDSNFGISYSHRITLEKYDVNSDDNEYSAERPNWFYYH